MELQIASEDHLRKLGVIEMGSEMTGAWGWFHCGWGCRRKSNSFFFISSFLSCKKCSEIYPLHDSNGILSPGSPMGV